MEAEKEEIPRRPYLQAPVNDKIRLYLLPIEGLQGEKSFQ
jgi:hypothetical protein